MNVLYRLCLVVLIVVYVVGLAVTVLLVRNMIRPLTALSIRHMRLQKEISMFRSFLLLWMMKLES